MDVPFSAAVHDLVWATMQKGRHFASVQHEQTALIWKQHIYICYIYNDTVYTQYWLYIDTYAISISHWILQWSIMKYHMILSYTTHTALWAWLGYPIAAPDLLEKLTSFLRFHRVDEHHWWVRVFPKREDMSFDTRLWFVFARIFWELKINIEWLDTITVSCKLLWNSIFFTGFPRWETEKIRGTVGAECGITFGIMSTRHPLSDGSWENEQKLKKNSNFCLSVILAPNC